MNGQLRIKSVLEQVDGRLEYLESQGFEPQYLLIGYKLYEDLATEATARGLCDGYPSRYKDVAIVVDPDQPWRLAISLDPKKTVDFIRKNHAGIL